MKFTRIHDMEHPLFAEAWRLYLKSFPPEERRQLQAQRKVMPHRQYHFELITHGRQFIGIVLWWGFYDVRYVEHLATLPRLRGRGFGRRVLNKFLGESSVPVLLEVEHPTTEMARRRIAFYRRAGFLPNACRYTHPPYKRNGREVSLLLMSSPRVVSPAVLRRFVEHHHRVIHAWVLKNC